MSDLKPYYPGEQDKEFAMAVMPCMLRDAVEWISKNLAPDEVFSEKALKHWAVFNIPKEEFLKTFEEEEVGQ